MATKANVKIAAEQSYPGDGIDMAACPKLPQPEVLGGVVPYLNVDGATKAADFYKTAFGATQVFAMPPDDKGRTMHVHLYVNGGSLMLCDPYPEHGHPHEPAKGYTLHMKIQDIDAPVGARRGRRLRDRAAAAEDVLGRPLRPAPRPLRRHVVHGLPRRQSPSQAA